jgi:hypothetical protein
VPEIPPRPGDEHVAPGLDVDELLAVVGLTRPAWMRDAACRGHDPAVFFPGRTGAARTLLVEARRICAACPVVEECRDHAVSRGERFGVWGGLSEKQRREVRRRRRQPP